MQRLFRVSPPAVHQMVVSLEKAGFIARKTGVVTVMGKTGTARFEVVATAPTVIARIARILKAM